MAIRRRILQELRLDKIAAVDKPCQEGAVMAIMKRAPDEADGGSNYTPLQKETSMNDFRDEVARVAKADGITKVAACEKVRLRRPDLYSALQANPMTKAAPARIEKSAAQLRFEERIAEVAKRDGLKMTMAADKARREFPREFAAAYV